MANTWQMVIIYAIGISLLLTVLVIPQILQVSISKRLFDRPNERKIHNGVVPRLGGFAFLPVMLLTTGVILSFPMIYSPGSTWLSDSGTVLAMPRLIVLFAAMTIMFLTGLYDDLLGLKYGMKFIAQLLAGILLVSAGNFILDYDGLFGLSVTGLWIGKIISVFLVVYVVNALNLIDGIDGLAAGISVVSLVVYGLALFACGLFIFSMISWIGAACVAVFWFFNVFGSKKRHTKIFMGDIGSLSIGVVLSFMVLAVAGNCSAPCQWQVSPIIIALSPIVIPLFDVIRVFCIRIYHGTSPFLPDKRHVHHLLLDAGLSMRMAMVLLLTAQIFLIILNFWLASITGPNFIVIVDVVFYALCIWTASARRRPQ